MIKGNVCVCVLSYQSLSISYVFCDSLRRLDTVCLIRVIFTRFSLRSPTGAAGAAVFGAGAAAVVLGAAAGAAVFGAAAAGAAALGAAAGAAAFGASFAGAAALGAAVPFAEVSMLNKGLPTYLFNQKGKKSVYKM
jgi:hypothetical protein